MSLPLVFEAPKRSFPPRHLADLTVDERREAVVALGEKAFRAEQLARGYFSGKALEEMTDLSAASRERLSSGCTETLTSPCVSRDFTIRLRYPASRPSLLRRDLSDTSPSPISNSSRASPRGRSWPRYWSSRAPMRRVK